MLKIKHNVDLEKLKKFGFKPKYNEDTGELSKYVKRDIQVNVKTREFCYSRFWNGECYEYCLFTDFIEDTFVDLVIAGFIEKVEED